MNKQLFDLLENYKHLQENKQEKTRVVTGVAVICFKFKKGEVKVLDGIVHDIVLVIITTAINQFISRLFDWGSNSLSKKDFRKRLYMSPATIMDISGRWETPGNKAVYVSDVENNLVLEFIVTNKGNEKLYMYEGFLEGYKDFIDGEEVEYPSYSDQIERLSDTILTDSFTSYYYLGKANRYLADVTTIDSSHRFKPIRYFDNKPKPEKEYLLDYPNTVIEAKSENHDLIILKFGAPGHYSIKIQIKHYIESKKRNKEEYIESKTFQIVVLPQARIE